MDNEMQEKAEEIKKDLIKYDGYSEEEADKLVKSAVKMAEAGRSKIRSDNKMVEYITKITKYELEQSEKSNILALYNRYNRLKDSIERRKYILITTPPYAFEQKSKRERLKKEIADIEEIKQLIKLEIERELGREIETGRYKNLYHGRNGR